GALPPSCRHERLRSTSDPLGAQGAHRSAGQQRSISRTSQGGEFWPRGFCGHDAAREVEEVRSVAWWWTCTKT
ncbi:hypothetical protein LTR16_010162, partial [Cryomyces antarcticus]